MKKKILWLGLSFLLVAALVLASCGPTEEEGEQEEEVGEEEVVLPSAQEIIDGTINSLGNIKSHRFDTGISLEMAGEAGVVETSMAMVLSGAMDLENKEMSADVTMIALIPGEEDEMEIVMEIYIVDDMIYMKTEMPEMEPVWEKGKVSETDWEEMTEIIVPTESYLDLLELADVSVIGSEEVNGVDCYVLQLTPNLEDLWETATQQIGMFEVNMPAIAEEVLQEVFTNFSVKQWVAKDTYFLTKSEIDISMEVTPEVKEVMEAEGMMTMDIALSFLAYDHNKPLSIVLPPEALELEEEEEEEVPTPVVEEEEEEVTFPDKNLEDKVRNALGKPVGEEITATDLAQLTILEAGGSGITDLTGLEYCTSLTRLDLGGNQISDITPLESLISLTFLNLDNNHQISNISPLSNVTSLTELGLGENQISNITPLESLTSLIALNLKDNQISDISPLVENSGIGAGDMVMLLRNNLDLSEGSDDMENIKTLEDRGVEVFY